MWHLELSWKILWNVALKFLQPLPPYRQGCVPLHRGLALLVCSLSILHWSGSIQDADYIATKIPWFL